MKTKVVPSMFVILELILHKSFISEPHDVGIKRQSDIGVGRQS